MNTNTAEKKGLNISAKSFISALAVIFVLMVLTYILTFIVPGGGIPFWKWALSPVLVLGAEVGGIDYALRDIIDLFVEIPMRGRKESFNVSVAAGVALFALTV